MANGGGKVLKWLGLIITIVVIAAGVISGYAVNNYRIGQTEQNEREHEAANKYEHEAIMKEAAAMQKEVLSAVTDLKVEIAAIKTEVRMIRRNHNGNDR